MTLEQFITDPKTGKRIPGALTRVSEHLGISRMCLTRYLREEWLPNMAMNRRIQDMIHSRIPLTDHRKTRSGRKKLVAH
jgi:hypothetical protein